MKIIQKINLTKLNKLHLEGDNHITILDTFSPTSFKIEMNLLLESFIQHLDESGTREL